MYQYIYTYINAICIYMAYSVCIRMFISLMQTEVYYTVSVYPRTFPNVYITMFSTMCINRHSPVEKKRSRKRKLSSSKALTRFSSL